ncbi:MAG: metallophosphoesterase [Spirochaetes bacterium]|nr:metallophosphoesterase [Spirochaetota bacterium]
MPKKIIFILFFLVAIVNFLHCSDSPDYQCRREFEILPKISGAEYLEFIAVGDTGTGAIGQYYVALAMRKYAIENPLRFVILLGDNFYIGELTSVNDPIFNELFVEMYDKIVLNVPFYAILGNHDYMRDINVQIAYTDVSDRWYMPDRYYTFSYTLADSTRIDFFVIDTTPIASGLDESAQIAWLQEKLSKSNARWKIVAGHHPIYSNGHYGNNQIMLENIEPLLQAYKVDLYFNGHDHDLEIIEPINGLVHAISGGGAKMRSVSCGENTVYSASILGFMAVRISRDSADIQVVKAYGNIDFFYRINK